MPSDMQSGDCAVALLDILGSRTYDMEVAPKVRKRIDILRQSIDRVIEECRKQSEEQQVQLIPPQYMAFGDSVLLLWQLGDKTNYLPFFGYALASVFLDCLTHGVPLRGALSFGHVLYDDRIAVGPAISDAAEWYEAANALGILLTPRTALLVDAYRPQDRGLIDEAFAKFRFRLKDITDRRTMWAVSWPSVLKGRHNGDDLDALRARLVSTLHDQFVIPRGTETKYQEALRFFDECARRWEEQT